MTFAPTEPTPCLLDNRWLTLNPDDIAFAKEGCRACPVRTECRNAFIELTANADPDFELFEGVMAGEVCDPNAERRRQARIRLARLNTNNGGSDAA